VAVPLLCSVETYASVHHLTSVVTGRLSQGRDVLDLIAASFPGGSITGAPKIRAMEIIAELEREDRGIYCGSIGWLGFDGAADLNIAIRTLSFDGETATVAAGGGITLLSEPDAEYEETLAKAERLVAPFAGTARADEEAAA
jgi:para-aminobenzoate synthetase component 1